MVHDSETDYRTYEQPAWSGRTENGKRVAGGSSIYHSPSGSALVLTHLRLHIPQEVVAKLFGATHGLIEAEYDLREDGLRLGELTDGQILVDATKQQIYRSQVSPTRNVHYLGKKSSSP